MFPVHGPRRDASLKERCPLSARSMMRWGAHTTHNERSDNRSAKDEHGDVETVNEVANKPGDDLRWALT